MARERGEPPVALITGCTSGGIGHALARHLAGRGVRVFATARRPDAAVGLPEIGVRVLPLDVTDARACADAVDDVIAEAGRLDILVNNAGIVTMGPTCEVPLDAARRAFDTNVFGLLALAQAAHPAMVAQGGGKIVNVGSLTGLQPVPLRGIYSATKAAVQRLSDAMRIELAPFGVQVMLVAPGFIDTHARDDEKVQANCAPPSGGLWGRWLDALKRVTAARLSKAVPVDTYAAALGSVILRPRMPRAWVGPTAGLEWLPRFMPAWLRDRVLARSLGVDALLPEMRLAAAVLAEQRRRQQQQGGGGGKDEKKAR